MRQESNVNKRYSRAPKDGVLVSKFPPLGTCFSGKLSRAEATSERSDYAGF